MTDNTLLAAIEEAGSGAPEKISELEKLLREASRGPSPQILVAIDAILSALARTPEHAHLQRCLEALICQAPDSAALTKCLLEDENAKSRLQKLVLLNIFPRAKEMARHVSENPKLCASITWRGGFSQAIACNLAPADWMPVLDAIYNVTCFCGPETCKLWIALWNGFTAAYYKLPDVEGERFRKTDANRLSLFAQFSKLTPRWQARFVLASTLNGYTGCLALDPEKAMTGFLSTLAESGALHAKPFRAAFEELARNSQVVEVFADLPLQQDEIKQMDLPQLSPCHFGERLFEYLCRWQAARFLYEAGLLDCLKTKLSAWNTNVIRCATTAHLLCTIIYDRDRLKLSIFNHLAHHPLAEALAALDDSLCNEGEISGLFCDVAEHQDTLTEMFETIAHIPRFQFLPKVFANPQYD